MPQTAEGAKKAAETIRKRYGEDYHANIGRKGGQVKTAKGFSANRELAREAGRKGGAKSRRTKNEDNS